MLSLSWCQTRFVSAVVVHVSHHGWRASLYFLEPQDTISSKLLCKERKVYTEAWESYSVSIKCSSCHVVKTHFHLTVEVLVATVCSICNCFLSQLVLKQDDLYYKVRKVYTDALGTTYLGLMRATSRGVKTCFYLTVLSSMSPRLVQVALFFKTTRYNTSQSGR